MWTPISADHTFIMVDPLGLGFFDATFVLKVPGAPPKKKIGPIRSREDAFLMLPAVVHLMLIALWTW